jgi:hypothetical protein
MTFMNKAKWIDILTRAAWTFAEGFFVTLFATVNLGMDEATLKAAVLGSAMAGVSALKTFVVNLLKTE